MCGILSAYPNIIKSTDSIKNSLNRLSHRGPDNQSYWLSTDNSVLLGHTRLSIIDLQNGNQPLSNEDDSLIAVVNGEFYNYEIIRSDLEKKGHIFKTNSDSEILIHLYEEFGTQCLQYLRGEFSFILWDQNNQQLFAARDRFGIKPLFYSFFKNSLFLASEVKALFSLGIPPLWNLEGLIESSYFLTTTQCHTLFQNIYQIPPGSFIVKTSSNHKIVKYWDFKYPYKSTLPKMSDIEYIEAFQEKLDEAIRVRLRADFPICCYLSGGIDSCSILAKAQQNSKTPIEAFTLSFDHPHFDEAEIAKKMANFCGANLNIIPITQNDLADQFENALWHAESLCFNNHGIAKYILSKIVSQSNFKVVLTGEGADEILAGYPHSRFDMYTNNIKDPQVKARLINQVSQEYAALSGILLPKNESISFAAVQKALNYTPAFFKASAPIAFLTQQLYSQDSLNTITNKDFFSIFLNQLEIKTCLKDRDPINQSLYLWSKYALPNYILSILGDRMEMAHSIEGRLPFLDHELVELSCELPTHLKINGSTEKYILKESMKPFIIRDVYEKSKHPFTAPPAITNTKSRMYQLLQDTLQGPLLKVIPLYNQKKVLASLEKTKNLPLTEQYTMDMIFTQILSACLLQKHFNLGY